VTDNEDALTPHLHEARSHLDNAVYKTIFALAPGPRTSGVIVRAKGAFCNTTSEHSVHCAAAPMHRPPPPPCILHLLLSNLYLPTISFYTGRPAAEKETERRGSGVFRVTETAQVEVRRGRVEAPATRCPPSRRGPGCSPDRRGDTQPARSCAAPLPTRMAPERTSIPGGSRRPCPSRSDCEVRRELPRRYRCPAGRRATGWTIGCRSAWRLGPPGA